MTRDRESFIGFAELLTDGRQLNRIRFPFTLAISCAVFGKALFPTINSMQSSFSHLTSYLHDAFSNLAPIQLAGAQ